jgi:hypothetical protein
LINDEWDDCAGKLCSVGSLLEPTGKVRHLYTCAALDVDMVFMIGGQVPLHVADRYVGTVVKCYSKMLTEGGRLLCHVYLIIQCEHCSIVTSSPG